MRAAASSQPSPEAALRELDGLLFAGGWFAINPRNVRVAGVRPGTLRSALELVGRGEVATIVGELRPEVRAVDVDLAGDLGAFATETIADWCRRRGLWHLVRPSGGAYGRAHVLVVPGVHLEDLHAQVLLLRRELRAGRNDVDLRTHLRPLSAPHRLRGMTPAPDGAAAALDELRSLLPVMTAAAGTRRPPKRRAEVVSIAGPQAPLTPAGRRRRDLDEAWSIYLARGRRAAGGPFDRDPSSRSQIELEATTQFVICGWSEDEAWRAITGAHPEAFTKARSRGRRWWWHVWNRAVTDADAWLREARTSHRPDATVPEAEQLRAHLEQNWLSWPARTRRVDYEVCSVIAEEMDRVGSPDVALAQRELLLLCAIAGRQTIRDSLARLKARGVLTVLPTYAPGTTDSSNTLTLGPAVRTDEQDPDGTAVSPSGPHRFQPPQPRPALPLRQSLGLLATHLLQSLPPADQPGLPLHALGHLAGLLDPAVLEPSTGQVRTVRRHLQELAGLGLAVVDELGMWHAAAGHTPEQVSQLLDVGRAVMGRKAAAVAAERTAFREALDADARRLRWQRQREVAQARSAKLRRARQLQWWSDLSEYERAARREAQGAAFAGLSPAEQARRKYELAAQRTRAGERESARYREWIKQQDPSEFARRCQKQAVAFALRPAFERAQLARDWALHRTHWRLPGRPQPDPDHSPARPHGVTLPEEVELHRATPSVEQQVLWDEPTPLWSAAPRGAA